MHMDPKLFPDPENFEPERFSPENKGTRAQGLLLAFGEGPRACMGTKIVELEVKVLLFSVLRKYELLPGDKLCNPPKTNVEGALMPDQIIKIRPRC